MTILYVFEIFYPEINGILTSTINLAKNLIEMGHKIVFLVPQSQETPQTLLDGKILIVQIPGFPVYIYPGLKCCLPFSQVPKEVMTTYDVDIVHITGPFSLGWRSIKVAQKKGIPVVHTFHTMLLNDDYFHHIMPLPFFARFLKKAALAYGDSFINKSIFMTAPSLKAKCLLEDLYPEVTVRVIPNGVDVEALHHFQSREQWKARYPYLSEKTFLFIGRNSAEKSIDVLLKAFALSCKQDPQIMLIIVGDGPAHRHLKSMALHLELDRNVFFTGKIPHDQVLQQGFFHHTRAFITASVSETHSVTAIEALCCGLPVIAADDRSNREVTQDAGCYFTPEDYQGLSYLILQWAQQGNPSYQRCQAEALKYRNQFDGRHVAKQFEIVYQSLINNKHLSSTQRL